ncbi:PAS domain S-box-containing protein/diguanylate cyclase (GGDEF) domain-containing protein [Formivibrio citricus]|uniref:PAS domain S-box-containing protein/diguanylate cyclase (GGDEF) domain-containing protein n=1 Tax=Formivibrio citricus TaxID=83765 RepID=A0A1I5D4A0_9NEIS|nr:EAL domain-containing protein [Formivibrio citricus]SFN93701.1 PAS domain S-box-containing protein/diguanylate cyclase (GGDEF) domain-containing protein [Formivibrio citricus]
MLKIPFLTSLRSRLIVACVLLQGAVLAALLFSTIRVWNDTVARATEVRVAELSRLLSVAFAAPLSVGDLARAADLLDGIRAPEGIDYLILLDANGRIIAARGWDISRPLPEIRQLKERGVLPALVDAATPISQGGEKLGELRFGISTGILREGVSSLARQGAVALFSGLVLSVLLLMLTGLWLTRHLHRLIAVTEAAANGTYKEMDTAHGSDEIVQLSQRFNEMARSIRDRVVALSQSEERFHIIADYTYSAELWLNPEGKLVWVNASIARLTGYAVNECMLLPDFPLILATPEERGRLADALEFALQNRTTSQDFEFRGQSRDGRLFWASLAWQPLFDGRGQYLGLRASLRDNSELKDDRLALRKAVAELRQIHSLGQSYLARAETERARLMALLSAMRFGVLFVDNDNRIAFHNPAFCELWGVSKSQNLVGRAIGMVLQQAENRPMVSDVLTTYLEDRIQADARIDHGELTMNDGRIITQHCYRVLDQQGVANGRMWIYEDVTQERLLADHMVNLAERDALTGLYNRHRFQQELERMVSDTDRRQGAMALLFFDLDEFKHVNDTLGHGVGDQLLQVIAKEVGHQVRRHEVLARLGGDEFAVLVPDCNEYEVSRLAERIVMTVSQVQFSANGHSMRPSTSVGVAMFPQHAGNAAELVAHADSAMYQAKSAGKSTWRLYRREADQSRSVIARLSWKDRILDALKHDGFELHFQGIYHAADKSLAHLEALVRMKDAQSPGEIIMPGQFIPHAETTGKIIEIDRWVLHQVVDLLSLRQEIPSIAINISGRSFDEPGLPEYISRLLASRQVEPRRLLVELTETAAVSDMRDAQRFIDALRATGCTVCLDDFGTGFSSFAYLKQLKADVLKIDGLFIRDLPVNHDSEVFVRGMVAMARDMGKITIAEFVENEEIFNMLLEIGIDQVQGYYLDRPSREHPSLMR